MSEEKRNKISVAITINAVLLVFILLAVVIAQVVKIGVLKPRRDQLYKELEQYEQELEDAEDVLDRLQTDEEFYDTVIKFAQMGMPVPGADK